MIKQVKRAALYVRVSTDAQTVENQIAELSRVAEHRGWDIVEIYHDAGISGAKGRDKRPGLDGMLNRMAAHRCEPPSSATDRPCKR
jgi:DNA invertase Pin-like site-specific DNA recombinase